MSIQLLPSNLIFGVPRDVIGMLRCKHAHTLSWLDVYISPIKIILWVVTGCGMLVIAQWYKCSITSFFLENETKNPAKKNWNQIQISVLEKRAPTNRTLLQFIRYKKYKNIWAKARWNIIKNFNMKMTPGGGEKGRGEVALWPKIIFVWH